MSNIRLSGSVRNVQARWCVAGSCAAARAISLTRRACGASSLGRTLGRTKQWVERSKETLLAPVDAATAHANKIVTMSTDGDNHSSAHVDLGCHPYTYFTCGVSFARVKRSLSIVNFKLRIASFAWRASISAFAQRTRPSCIQHCLPLNAWRASRPTFALRGYPSAAFYAAELSPSPQHFASRQARPLPRRLRAEPKINGRLSDARLDKPRFTLNAQGFADSAASATTLACTSLLANLGSLSLSSLLPWLAPSCENATLACASLLTKVLQQKALPPPLPCLAHFSSLISLEVCRKLSAR